MAKNPWEENYGAEKAPWDLDYGTKSTEKKREGLLADVQRGIESTYSREKSGLKTLLGDADIASEEGLQRQKDIAQRLGEGKGSLEKIQQAYKKDGLLSAAKEVVSQAPGAIAENLPNWAGMLAAGRAGATAGSAIPHPAGPLVGGIIGTGAYLYPQFVGEHSERQKEISPEKPVDVQSAALYAIPSTISETAGTYVPFLGKGIGKILGPQVEKVLAGGGKEAAEKFINESLLATITKGTAVGAVADMPTEIFQSVMSRKQAGLDLLSDDALKEYSESAYGAALFAPVGTVGRLASKSATAQDVAEQNRQADIKKAEELRAEQDRIKAEQDLERQKPEYHQGLIDRTKEIESEINRLNSLVKHPSLGYEAKQEAYDLIKQHREEINNNIDLLKQYSPDRIFEIPSYKPKTLEEFEQYKDYHINKSNIFSNNTLQSLGVPKGAAIYKTSAVGMDISNPENANTVKSFLSKTMNSVKNQEVKDSISEYLKRPEFTGEFKQPEPGEPVSPNPPEPVAPAPEDIVRPQPTAPNLVRPVKDNAEFEKVLSDLTKYIYHPNTTRDDISSIMSSIGDNKALSWANFEERKNFLDLLNDAYNSKGTEEQVTKFPEPAKTPEEVAQKFAEEEINTTNVVEKDLAGMNFDQALDYAIENTTPGIKPVMQKVKDAIDKLKAAGRKFEFYIPQSNAEANLIGLSKRAEGHLDPYSTPNVSKLVLRGIGAGSTRGGVTMETLMHEQLHAATIAAIDYGHAHPGSSEAKIVKQLEDLSDFVKKEMKKRSRNGTLDPNLTKYLSSGNVFGKKTAFGIIHKADEIVSWGMTRSEFRNFLESVKYKNGTAFDAFVTYIRKLIGLSPKEDTALSELVRLTSDILENPNPTASARQTSTGGQNLSPRESFAFEPEPAITASREAAAPAAVKHKMTGVDPSFEEELSKTFGSLQPQTLKQKYDSIKPKLFDNIINGLFDEIRAMKKYGMEGYMKATLSKSSDGGLSGLLLHGQIYDKDGAMAVRPGTKGYVEIMKPVGKEMDRYNIWKALNRDSRLPAEKRSFQHLIKDKDQLLSGDIDGKSRKDVYESVLKEENELNKSVLDYAKKKGLINQEMYNRFSNDIYYIPFYKALEDGEISSIKQASKMTGQQFSKALKGGEKRIEDLTENVLRNWSHILSAANKNDAAVTTLKSAEDMGGATKVKSAEDGKDVVKVMENGEIAYYDVHDQDLLNAIAAVNYVEKSTFLGDAGKKFTNALRIGVTASPAYKVRNLLRDTVASIGLSPIGLKAITNMNESWGSTNKNNQTYIDMLAGGGAFNLGVMHEGNRSTVIKNLIAQGVKPDTILDSENKLQFALKKLWMGYEEFGNRFENINRAALYNKLISEGKTHLEASYEARDLLNFTGQGHWKIIKTISNTVPFFNTRLQGLYKIGRDGITPTYRVLCNMTTGKPIEESDAAKAKRFATVSASVALASMALYSLYKDDEDFKKREDWDRDNFWWFKINGTAYRIPKPFEIGAFGTIAERSLEQMSDDNVEGKVFFQRMKQILMDTFSLDPTPQWVKPMVGVYSNVNPFTNAPIESVGLERYSKEERYTERTSEGAKLLSKAGLGAAGLSPVQIDYLAGAYFGWLGNIAGNISSMAVKPWDQVQQINKPVVDIATQGMVQTLPQTQSKFVTNFYHNNKVMQESFNDMKRFAENGEMEKVANIMAEKGNEIALSKVYAKATDQMAEYRKYMNNIDKVKTMTAEERRDAKIRVQVLMSDLAERMEALRVKMKQK